MTEVGDIPDEAVAWLHTLHMEGGQISERVTFDEYHTFGKPGIDYDRTYSVTSEPLYLTAAYPFLLAHLDKSAANNKSLVAENARLRELQKLVVAYDDLLLCFKGPSIIFDGDVKEIDEAFDRMVIIARSLTEAKKP